MSTRIERIKALFEQRDLLTGSTDGRADNKAMIAAIDKELVALGYPADGICDRAEAAHRGRLARAKELIDAYAVTRSVTPEAKEGKRK